MWPIPKACRCVRRSGTVLRTAASPSSAMTPSLRIWSRPRHREAAPHTSLACLPRNLFTLTSRRSAPSDTDAGKDGNVPQQEMHREVESYPDYFFHLHPDDADATVSAAATATAASGEMQTTTSHQTSESSPAEAVLPPPPPPPSPPVQPFTPPGDVSAADWAEFQQYLHQVEDADPEFIAYAEGYAAPVGTKEREEAMAEAAHLLRGGFADGSYTSGILNEPPLPPPMSMAAVTELEEDWAQEDALDRQWHAEDAEPPSHTHNTNIEGEGEVMFGDDADTDHDILTALKGRPIRLQNVPDTVVPPLLIPDKDGNVAAAPRPVATRQEEALPEVHLLSPHGFLAAQDRLYLAPRTPPEAQVQQPTSSTTEAASSSLEGRQCILVVFSANDLRVHDNYLLALASMRARMAAGAADEEAAAGGGFRAPVDVVAACVLDYRTFAQPSVVGGFFRQSPQRAQYLLDTVSVLRRKLESTLQVPLLVRCGRPEEHVPRLAAELGATDVFVTTQYAPHERRVQALMLRRLRQGVWVSREDVTETLVAPPTEGADVEDDEKDPLVAVVEHRTAVQHPYRDEGAFSKQQQQQQPAPVVHSVWQSTLVHLDDLPTPLAAMKEGERWLHDDVTVSTIRPTAPYDASTQQLANLPMTWQRDALLPSPEEKAGRAAPSVLRGSLPTLEDLGYAAAAAHGTDFAFQEVLATETSHPTAGEDAALLRMREWLDEGGMTSLLRYGRDRRTNTKMYSQKLARLSPYIAVGALSPRRYYEVLRQHAHENLRDGFVQQQFREGLLRLSRRDYWHWMGLRFGDRLFYSYGPHPEQTDDVPDWRHDKKVVQRWCGGLTGIPFADAAMRELVGTGFVAAEGRQALVWLLARGYGQDWRLAAEWLERCSLDYDPFVCYGNVAYSCGLLVDDFGEPVRNVHYLAHHHDQTGIYIKKWLPQLSKVPPVYIHRPHILTARMQAMHGVYLGKNYPYPLKLWQAAQRTLTAAELPAYFAAGIRKGPGYAEAVRYGSAVMPPEEFSAAVSPTYVQHRTWTAALPASAFADVSGDAEAEEATVVALAGRSAASRFAARTRTMAS